MTYDGKEVLTWANFCYQPSQIGAYVTESMVDDLLDMVPPRCMNRELAQMGEPFCDRQDPLTGEWKSTYMTFKRITYGVSPKRPGIWQYCGHCFLGESTERWKGWTA